MSSFYLTLLPALVIAATDARADSWPAKPLTAVVPFAAGSVTDVVPRIVFKHVEKAIGQPIVIENRPGAGGTIAAAHVAKAAPDGYTLLVNSSAHTIAPALYPTLRYSPAGDFAATASLGILPNVLVVPSIMGFKTAREFVYAAQVNPFLMNFASAGVGTATHLSALRFQSSAGIKAVHVPFKGGPEAIAEIIAGRIDFFFAPVGVAKPHVEAGKLTALAVNSAKRSAVLPDVPTTSEAGFSNAEYPFWIGVFLPAKTPRDIVEKLHSETMKALQEPEVRNKLAQLGVDPMPMTPSEFDAAIEKQIVSDAALVKSAGVKTN